MEKLRQLVEYYYSKGIYVYPVGESFSWKTWRLKNQKLEEVRAYNWSQAKGIMGVVGRKGVRVLVLHDSKLTEEALSLLGRDKDYPWIFRKKEGTYVLFESEDGSINQTNLYFQDFTLLWQDTFELPSDESAISLIYSQPPLPSLPHINNQTVYNCLKDLDNYKGDSQTLWSKVKEFILRLFHKKE